MCEAAPTETGWMARLMEVGRGHHRRESGFTYLALLIAIAVAGIALAATGEVWSISRQREKERELIFIGDQFRQAIALYYLRTPGQTGKFPNRLEDLLEDRRYLTTQRYLRRIFRDPMTGKSDWGLIIAPEGGIMGVHSLSPATPIKAAGFRFEDRSFEGSARYSDWKFVYEAVVAARGAGSISSADRTDRSVPAGAPSGRAAREALPAAR